MAKPKPNPLFRRDIAPRCVLCQLGRPTADGKSVLCPKKGVMPALGHCRRFVYAPTRREPLRTQPPAKLQEEDFSL